MGTPEERAALIRESIRNSQTVTDSMVTILGSFDHRLSALQTAMRPTQVNYISICLYLYSYVSVNLCIESA